MIVSSKKKRTILNSGRNKLNWISSDIPENISYYDIFKGELYHSEVYDEKVSSYKNNIYYSNIEVNQKNVAVAMTVEEYRSSFDYDCSEIKNYILYPSKFLFELVEANFGKNDSCIYSKDGEVIGYDTSAYFNVPHQCFLIKRELLDNKLKENDLDIIWSFYGEKEEIGPDISYVYRMLFSGFAGFEKNDLKIFHFFKEQTPTD